MYRFLMSRHNYDRRYILPVNDIKYAVILPSGEVRIIIGPNQDRRSVNPKNWIYNNYNNKIEITPEEAYKICPHRYAEECLFFNNNWTIDD